MTIPVALLVGFLIGLCIGFVGALLVVNWLLREEVGDWRAW